MCIELLWTWECRYRFEMLLSFHLDTLKPQWCVTSSQVKWLSSKYLKKKCWGRCREKDSLKRCCSVCKLVQPLWKTVWRFLKLKIVLPFDLIAQIDHCLRLQDALYLSDLFSTFDSGSLPDLSWHLLGLNDWVGWSSTSTEPQGLVTVKHSLPLAGLGCAGLSWSWAMGCFFFSLLL